MLFLKEFKWTLLAGFIVLGIYLYSTFQGVRVCDCNTTEQYNPNETRNSKSHFYHK